MEIKRGGCWFPALFAASMLLIAVYGISLMITTTIDTRQTAQAAIAQADSEARQKEAEEATEQLDLRLAAEAEARRDFYLALAAFTDSNTGLIAVLAGALGAAVGIQIVWWLERRTRL